MTATEELLALLDARGVEYVLDEEHAEKYPPEQRVTWSCDLAGENMTVTAQDYCIGTNDDGRDEYCLDLEFHEAFTPEQAIAATLECDGEYERKMDSLLCRLTNGLYSKTKAYSLDFMESCVEEAFEARNARQTSTTHAVIVSDESTDCATGHCECELCGHSIDPWDRFCRHCGAEVVDR